MSERTIKSFTYKCRCGYVINVHVDFGAPQETVACRRCKSQVSRTSV